MIRADRYDVSDPPEAQWQPGSRKRVLRNLLGITCKRDMDQAEGEAQYVALRELIDFYSAGHRFTAADIRHMHKTWLGSIYPWAGSYRQVQISKGDITFAAAGQLPSLMADLEQGPLKDHTPCRFTSDDRVIEALAVVHVELVLIHPFREGNGRVARMLAVLMGLQAGLPLLDFGGIKGKKLEEYFAAVRAGLDRDYRPMETIFRKVIERTLRGYDRGQSTSSGRKRS